MQMFLIPVKEGIEHLSKFLGRGQNIYTLDFDKQQTSI